MNGREVNDHAVDANRGVSELQERYSNLIQTQCQRSIRILGESTEERPLSLKDFRDTLEKSVLALNVSFNISFSPTIKYIKINK